MIAKRTLQASLAGVILAGGGLLALPAIASAAPGPHGFASDQQQLELQLANRVSQLNRLSSDVTASKTIPGTHALVLNTNISTAIANINALVSKVPADTTQAQLKMDRASMLQQNRVFAVLTPQVFQTIEADAIAAQVVALQANEPALQSSVTSLVGQHGHTNAANHYAALVRSVNQAAADSNTVAATVLAQTPANYPGDTHIFVSANKQLLNADLALAHATYDESVIGLAAGGYTGP